jgi:hypothetical protein
VLRSEADDPALHRHGLLPDFDAAVPVGSPQVPLAQAKPRRTAWNAFIDQCRYDEQASGRTFSYSASSLAGSQCLVDETRPGSLSRQSTFTLDAQDMPRPAFSLPSGEWKRAATRAGKLLNAGRPAKVTPILTRWPFDRPRAWFRRGRQGVSLRQFPSLPARQRIA